MDIVITYVNGLDPKWQEEYAKHTNTPIMEKRFRDWGTLKYLFRGIEKNMPFIRRVHLVVSGESQVPAWINRERVNVVLHRDIIPEDHLPTFCSNTIELHLHRIEGLDEEFLYFNDDIFPMMRCEATDFFLDGKGIIGMNCHLFAPDMFKRICRNSDRAARKALGRRAPLWFLRPQHICAPMLRSESQHVYQRLKDDILNSLTATRTERNITQYLFTNYLFLKGRIIPRRQPRRHFSVGLTSPEKISAYLLNPDRRLVCINDVQLSEGRYDKMRTMLLDTFERAFPTKSRFEL